MLSRCLLALALLHGAAAAAPSTTWDQPMATLLRVNWSDPHNPGLVPVGQDRFLFDTTDGVRLWDATTAQFMPLRADRPPGPGQLDRLLFGFQNTAPVKAGTLLVALSANQSSATLWGWRTATQSLAEPLPLPGPEPKRWGLQGLDAQHALACHPSLGAQVLQWAPAPANTPSNTNPRWAPPGDPQARAALQAKGVVGPVQGFGTLALAAAPAARPPVFFDTRRCAWELTQPPADLARWLDPQRRGDRHPIIKPYFLNDGRVLVPGLQYFDDGRPGWRWLTHPLLWDASARQWQVLPSFRNERPSPHRSGQGEPVLAAGQGSSQVEALHLPTLSWRRYNEQLPFAWNWLLEPLQSGQVLVAARGDDIKLRGIVGRITPSDGSTPSGRLQHRRDALYQEAVVPGRYAVLVGSGRWADSDVAESVDLASAQSTELPRLPAGAIWPAFPTGVALPDASVLVLAGLPKGCAREEQFMPTGVCADRLGQPSWRYLPSARRWEPVLALKIPYARGPSWQWGNSDRSTQWPRADLTVRASGDLVWLQGGEFPDSRERELWPRATALMAWSPQQPELAPRRIAPLRKGRVSGSLVNLADGRLAVVGGDAQLDRVALEKGCADCPDEFVSIGPMRAARSTELLDESDPQAPRWVNGPLAHFPGGQGFRLANGRIVKVSLREPMGENGVQAEVADAAFTQWTRLAMPPPVSPRKGDSHHDIRFVTAIGNRVLVLTNSDATLVWDDDASHWRLHAGWPGQHDDAAPLSIVPGAKPGQVMVRYPRTVRLIDLPKN